MTLLASFVLTVCSLSSNVLANNFNVSDSYNNINVNEIEFALREDGLGILGFEGIHRLTSTTAKKPILVTQPTLPSLKEFTVSLEKIWKNKWHYYRKH